MWKYTLIVCGLLYTNIQPVQSYEPSFKPVVSPPPLPNVGINNTPYEVGMASYYGRAHAGRKTASGAIFNPKELTAAHNRLPMGTIVEVRSIDTGKSVVVKITDTGGFRKYGRIIDVSEKAASIMGILHQGIGRVELRILHKV